MKETLRQALVILAISLAAALLTALFHPGRPPWFAVENPAEQRWNLDLEGAKELLASKDTVLWVDARDRLKFQEGHYPGAILLNTDEWSDLMFQHMDRLQSAMGSPVIVYCDGSGCDKSREVAARLRELIGMDPVYILEGDWKEAAP